MKNASNVVERREKTIGRSNGRSQSSRRIAAVGFVALSAFIFGDASDVSSPERTLCAQTPVATSRANRTNDATRKTLPVSTSPNVGVKRFYDLSETPIPAESEPSPRTRISGRANAAVAVEKGRSVGSVAGANVSNANGSGTGIVPVLGVEPRSAAKSRTRPASVLSTDETDAESSAFVSTPAPVAIPTVKFDATPSPASTPSAGPLPASSGGSFAVSLGRYAIAAPNEPSDASVPRVRLETLNEAIEIALAASRSQQALALKKNASRSVEQAARSLRNPKLTNATAYVGMLNQPKAITEIDSSAISQIIPVFPSTLQTETPLLDKNFAATATSVTIPIYLGGRVQALTESAEATTRALEAGEEVGEQNLKFEVSEAYFLVLRTRELNRVATEATAATAAHLGDAERLFKVGIATKNVVLAAQVAVAEARQMELRVETARKTAEAAYNRLLWRPLETPVNIADVGLGRPVGDLDALTAQATRNRSELRALTEESRALRAQEKVARADVLPQVAAVGTYAYLQNSNITENSNATGAVGVVWTPFDGGTSRARQEAARQEATSIARARDEAEESIRLQVYAAWVAEKEARQRVETARVAVEHAEENLRVVTRGFQEGLVNHTETLDATTLRTSAKSNLANAKYDAILAARRLRRAVGDL